MRDEPRPNQEPQGHSRPGGLASLRRMLASALRSVGSRVVETMRRLTTGDCTTAALDIQAGFSHLIQSPHLGRISLALLRTL